jgi:hypothetical protein
MDWRQARALFAPLFLALGRRLKTVHTRLVLATKTPSDRTTRAHHPLWVDVGILLYTWNYRTSSKLGIWINCTRIQIEREHFG